MSKTEIVKHQADEMTNIEKTLLLDSSYREGDVLFDDATLTAIGFAAAAAALGDDVVSSKDAMPSLDVLNGDDKDRLVKVPFLAVDWTFRSGDQGNFVSIRCITENDEVYLVNDGSTGIYRQMLNFSEQTGKFAGLFCRNGLRRSDYTYEDDKGINRPATTFYIA